MADRTDVAKGLVRCYVLGKDSVRRGSVAVLDHAGPARIPLARMQDAEADAVLLEGREGPAVEDVAQGAFAVAFDAALPREAQRPVLVKHLEGHLKGFVARVHPQAAEARRDGDPSRPAHGRVDPAQHLALAQADPPQLTPVEGDGQGAGAQGQAGGCHEPAQPITGDAPGPFVHGSR